MTTISRDVRGTWLPPLAPVALAVIADGSYAEAGLR